MVSAGKEARVYWGKDFEKRDLAVKIYLTTSAEFRRGLIKYLEADPRFAGRVPKSTRKLYSTWARKEFSNYMRMFKVGVSVPRPIAVHENILVMEFIGENGKPAPLLREVDPDVETLAEIFRAVMEDVRKSVLRARLVHGDLSEYNIMVWEGKHYIIDVSQAVTLDHPNALDYLYRDIVNVVRFFSKQGVETPRPEEIFKEIVSNLR